MKANNGLREADAPKEKIKIRETIWLIIRNKKKSNGTVTSDFIGLIMSHFFNLLSLISVCFSLLFIAVLVKAICDTNWSSEYSVLVNRITLIFVESAFAFLALVFSLVFRASANEMAAEKDRNYIMAVFSSVVSFAALVAALAALFKG